MISKCPSLSVHGPSHLATLLHLSIREPDHFRALSRMLHDLPIEVLYHILGYLDKRAQKALSAVSRKLNEECIPKLYENVAFDIDYDFRTSNMLALNSNLSFDGSRCDRYRLVRDLDFRADIKFISSAPYRKLRGLSDDFFYDLEHHLGPDRIRRFRFAILIYIGLGRG